MDAFISKEYATAQSYWRQAAEQGHAKATFNLGILNERGLIPGASDSTAEDFYLKAGELGYAAAYYHLAMVKKSRGADYAQIRPLLEEAAKGGIEPARQAIQGALSSVQIAPLQGDQDSEQLVGTSVAPTDDREKYLSEAWIGKLPNENWTIQLLAYRQKQQVTSFIDRYSLHSKAAYFEENSADGTWYKLIYGSYSSKQAADQARALLPASLKQFGPWLRTVTSVQNIIKAS